ncbi:hypothetical protein I9W82_001783 [Candida metapsilosis]|uniref:Uncharacterized protein n=1 Tax=Candida metapsilosis TaxID=273372 RepID=A0A8H8DB17_9ASCO|nr:hypothetical protein I9W82_001783 [Candida metapsilosis]
MATIDNEVNIGWFDSYIAYTKLKNVTPDDRVLEKKRKLETTITNQQQQLSLLHQQQQHGQLNIPSDGIDISNDAPNLAHLIESQGNDSEKLSQELKELLIKYYWAGFELHDKLEEANNTVERQQGEDIVEGNEE